MTSLFSPLPLGDGFPALPNRLVMGPMTLNQATDDGHITQWITDWYERRAAGGTGTLIGAAVFVSQALAAPSRRAAILWSCTEPTATYSISSGGRM